MDHLCVLTPFRLSQTSCITPWQPQMLPFSPIQLVQMWGSLLCFSFQVVPARPPGTGLIPLTLLFLLPSSYQVVHGSIYFFPVVRETCQYSAGALWQLLPLKMYSWCTLGERYIPHSSTPLPSCWLSLLYLKRKLSLSSFLLFLATLCNMQKLSSQVKDWTHTPCSGGAES